jgi:sirohydrochlorin ferrochelatase
MKGILLIDHGSRREEANEMLASMADLVQQTVGSAAIVRFAHMEIAEPTIAQGFAACVAAGADDIVAFPYMLSPGKHSTRDIPRMVSEAATVHPTIRYQVTEAFGMHQKLVEIILLRSGIEPEDAPGPAVAASGVADLGGSAPAPPRISL